MDEMCHTRRWVSLVATATVQLSITAGGDAEAVSGVSDRTGRFPEHLKGAWGATSTVVGLAVVLELGAGFAFVVVRAAAVEVALPVVALRLVVAGVGTARVPLNLKGDEEVKPDPRTDSTGG